MMGCGAANLRGGLVFIVDLKMDVDNAWCGQNYVRCRMEKVGNDGGLWLKRRVMGVR